MTLSQYRPETRRSLRRMVGRAYRRLTTSDTLRRGDQVFRDHAWRSAGGLDGWMWDTQIYLDSPPYRRPANGRMRDGDQRQ